MSLLAAIPGLSAHEVDVPAVVQPAPIVVSFDSAAAGKIIDDAVLEVAGAFPAPDPWGWLVANRPDVIAELKRSRNELSEAYRAEKIDLVKVKADRFIRLHLRAWELYKQRPPIIEVQGDLLN